MIPDSGTTKAIESANGALLGDKVGEALGKEAGMMSLKDAKGLHEGGDLIKKEDGPAGLPKLTIEGDMKKAGPASGEEIIKKGDGKLLAPVADAKGEKF